jgi:hypothetical protein
LFSPQPFRTAIPIRGFSRFAAEADVHHGEVTAGQIVSDREFIAWILTAESASCNQMRRD